MQTNKAIKKSSFEPQFGRKFKTAPSNISEVPDPNKLCITNFERKNRSRECHLRPYNHGQKLKPAEPKIAN